MRALSKPSSQLLMKLCQRHTVHPRPPAPILAVQKCRYSSSSDADINIHLIRHEMLSRSPQIHHDEMHTMNSRLLTRALSDFLPEECLGKEIPYRRVDKDDADFFHRPDQPKPLLPPGHHLVHFPLLRAGSELCPDGTDPFHSPRGGTPFTRRMWAGGSVANLRGLDLDDGPAVCLERIANVDARGSPGDEKIFVEVLREYVPATAFRWLYDPESKRLREPLEANPNGFKPGMRKISERRVLVFMRESSDEEKKANLEKRQRTVKSPLNPDYSVTLTPTPTLLFHYSALTYNAHRIHLDPAYCREVEGHRDLLVHGPLSLTLMLSVLQSRLPGDKGEYIDNVDYRNLAPLYAGEPMRICVARQKPKTTNNKTTNEEGGDKTKSSKRGNAKKNESLIEMIEKKIGDEGRGGENGTKWDIWVENKNGGLCVKGTAETTGPSYFEPEWMIDFDSLFQKGPVMKLPNP